MAERELLERLERAHQVLAMPDGVRLGPNGVAVVRSQTDADTLYLVSLQDGTCTCPDFRKRGRPCKHLLAARLMAKREEATRLARVLWPTYEENLID